MGIRSNKLTIVAYAALGLLLRCAYTAPKQAVEELDREPAVSGRRGGILVTAQRAEPKTFNPVTAPDTASREVIGLTTADLVHINRLSLKTEPALAKSWTVSRDGRIYVLHLRPGIRFSDGHPMDADDVLFTFGVYLDEKTGASQRDLLIIQGKPIVARKIDSLTVQFELAAPYAAAERLFDSLAILPRHLLWKTYEEGRLNRAWGIDTPPDQIAGLGPFRLKAYVPGQRVVLERNPYYWKADEYGTRLPYLDEIVFLFLASEDVQVVQFLSGATHIISNPSAENFLELRKREQRGNFRTYDLGPGFDYNVLLFNMNEAAKQTDPRIRATRDWFRDVAFRRAVSAAIDREAIVRLAYRGFADRIGGHVTEGNALWIDSRIPQTQYSPANARALLKSASYSWNDGALRDAKGRAVEFSILTTAGNVPRMQIATLIQHDLQQLGMAVSVVSLEFRTALDRIMKRLDYDATVMTLASGDADPNSEMNVWLSDGSMHLWNLSGKPQDPWEEEIDRLMRLQMITLQYPERRRLYDRVQELVSENLPIICLSSPHVLVVATNRLGNFHPAVLRPYALWNAESLYFRE